MAAMGDDDEGGEEIDVDQAKRMEDLVLKWLSSENDSQRRDADGYTEASVFAGMRKARRMGFSEEMVLIVARKSESLEVDGKRIRKAEKERRQDDLRKMLEFWFGAGNLRRDKFLAQNLRESTDAMVSVDTILGFNKIKAMNTTLEELIRAMENCPVLSLSEDKKRVGRKIALDLEPLPEGAEEERTVYLEPVPPHATHEDVAKFVEGCGPVEYISIPRFDTGEAKGFAFVEFRSPAHAEKCVAMNRATAVTNGVEDAENRLKVITKRQWLQLKQKFKEERKERKERVKQMKQITQFGYSVGVLVRVHGLNGNVKRQEIYESIETLCPVGYVEFRRSEPDECYIRFHSSATAASTTDALNNGDLLIGPAMIQVTARILRGREEAEKWDKIHQETIKKTRDRDNVKQHQPKEQDKQPAEDKKSSGATDDTDANAEKEEEKREKKKKKKKRLREAEEVDRKDQGVEEAAQKKTKTD